MAYDKLVDSSQLNSDLGDVADAIRAKSGGSSQLAFPSGFISEIGNISTGGGSSGITWRKVGEVPNMQSNNNNISNLATFDVPDLNFNLVAFKAQQSDAYKLIFILTQYATVSLGVKAFLMRADTYGNANNYPNANVSVSYSLQDRSTATDLTFSVGHSRATSTASSFYTSAGDFDVLIGKWDYDFSTIVDVTGS